MRLWHRIPEPPETAKDDLDALLSVTKTADEIVVEITKTMTEMSRMIQESVRESVPKHS